MGIPQLENGYTRIANELLDEIGRRDFTATQYGILLCIMRYTYGFGRKSHPLSASFISKWTGRSVRQVKRELKNLMDCHVVFVKNGELRGVTYEIGINKEYSAWKSAVSDTSDVHDTRQVTQMAPVLVTCMTPKKRNNIKKNIKKNIYGDFFENVWNLYPKKRGKSAVSEKAQKELYEAGTEKVTQAIEAYKKEIAGKDEKYVLHGSTFFNGRWKDYAPVSVAMEPIKPQDEIPEEAPIDLWTEE